jgi:hypothetical protein
MKRGFTLTVVLIIAAAMFSSNFISDNSNEISGNQVVESSRCISQEKLKDCKHCCQQISLDCIKKFGNDEQKNWVDCIRDPRKGSIKKCGNPPEPLEKIARCSAPLRRCLKDCDVKHNTKVDMIQK